MIRRLQDFAFNRSPYERPNLKWVCGRAAEGSPCRSGPTRGGRCRDGTECRPRPEGEGWVCNRPQSAGGRCDEGPGPDGSCARPVPPCQPVRSVRAKRGLAVRWAVVVAVGLVALALQGPNAASWLAPGGVSAPHTQVENCGDCHGEFGSGPTGWLHAAWGGVSKAGMADSERCLACHELGEQPMKPHGVAADYLESPSPSRQGALGSGLRPAAMALADRLLPPPGEGAGELACATCHSEHRGREADLTAMDSQRCQACHGSKFATLAAGHPDFGSYPHDRRTRLNFDHASHARKHFPDADNPPKRCVACHETGEDGAAMGVKGFDTACASCHAEDIHGEKAAGSPGIPVIAVPGLDLRSLRQAGVGIGAWPRSSDRDLTPFMRAIFAADPELVGALKRFRALDPLDLRDASEADMAAVAKIAWATKALIHRLLAEGPGSLRPALADALGRDIGARGARRLLGGMALETVRRAKEAWFPGLTQELARHRAGETVPIPGGQSEVSEAASDDSGEDVAEGGQGSSDAVLAGDDGNSGGGGDSILAGEDTGGDDGGGGILSGEESASDEGGSGILSGDESGGGGGLLGGDESGDRAQEPAAEPAEAEPPDPDPREWGRLGGWYRDYFALLYRPGGHGDRLLKGWLDLAGGAMAGDGRPGAAAIFRRLGSDDAPGRCTKCHSVDAREDGAVSVNWRVGGNRPDHPAFTRFAHAPHFATAPGDEGCAGCHKLAPDSDYQASFEDRDPATFQSNFRSIGREKCAGCHVADRAGNACTQCHRYHAGGVASEANRTRLNAIPGSSASH